MTERQVEWVFSPKAGRPKRENPSPGETPGGRKGHGETPDFSTEAGVSQDNRYSRPVSFGHNEPIVNTNLGVGELYVHARDEKTLESSAGSVDTTERGRASRTILPRPRRDVSTSVSLRHVNKSGWVILAATDHDIIGMQGEIRHQKDRKA